MSQTQWLLNREEGYESSKMSGNIRYSLITCVSFVISCTRCVARLESYKVGTTVGHTVVWGSS